jgi:hypothetical protein
MREGKLAIFCGGALTLLVVSYTCLACAFATPAWAQIVTLADLEGSMIDTTVAFEQSGLSNGRMYSGIIFRVDRQITFGPGNMLQFTVTRTVEYPRGGTRVQHGSGSATLGQPGEVSNFGGGHTVWLFSNGTLVNLRTYKAGGQKIEITFTRSAAGLSCRVRAPFAREEGGDIEMIGTFGGHLQHWTQKQISSSCRVSKR